MQRPLTLNPELPDIANGTHEHQANKMARTPAIGRDILTAISGWRSAC